MFSEERPGVWMIVACVLSAIVGILLIAFAAFICCQKMSSRRKGNVCSFNAIVVVLFCLVFFYALMF